MGLCPQTVCVSKSDEEGLGIGNPLVLVISISPWQQSPHFNTKQTGNECAQGRLLDRAWPSPDLAPNTQPAFCICSSLSTDSPTSDWKGCLHCCCLGELGGLLSVLFGFGWETKPCSQGWLQTQYILEVVFELWISPVFTWVECWDYRHALPHPA